MKTNMQLLKTRTRWLLLIALLSGVVTFHAQPLHAQSGLSFFAPFEPIPAEPYVVLLPPSHGNPITITNDGPPKKLSCGGFDWKVKFELSAASIAGGWIVQEYKRTRAIDKCDDTPDDHSVIHYWEAWRIEPGSTIDSARANGSYTFDDQYLEPSHPNRKGSVTVKGKVQFFEGAALPAGFIPNHPATIAGDLLSDTIKPPWFNTNEAICHDMSTVWVCCPTDTFDTMTVVYGDTMIVYADDDTIGDTTILVTTVPQDTALINEDDRDPGDEDDRGGKGRDPYDNGKGRRIKQGLGGGKTVPIAQDPIVRMIRMLPAWTQSLDEFDQRQFMTIAEELSKVPKDQLRDAIEQHWKIYRSATNNIEELSKTYVLIRVLFDAPEGMDRSKAQSFGGWVTPYAYNRSARYNPRWPVAVASNGELTVTGEFEGFYGRGYNVLAEYDFFASQFEARQFNSAKPGVKTPEDVIRMHPNPALSHFILQSDETLDQPMTIEVIDQFGFSVKKETVEFGNEYRVELGNVKRGLYFVVLTYGNQQSVRTLVVKR